MHSPSKLLMKVFIKLHIIFKVKTKVLTRTCRTFESGFSRQPGVLAQIHSNRTQEKMNILEDIQHE